MYTYAADLPAYKHYINVFDWTNWAYSVQSLEPMWLRPL